MRLNKWIAMQSTYSRRGADELIQSARVTVNGNTSQLGDQWNEGDSVKVDGKTINPREDTKAYTVLLNKPVGYVCSRKGQGAPTVYSLLPLKYHHLDIAGRLDKDSSGLVVLTNNGELLRTLTHPSAQKNKKYEIVLGQPLNSTNLARVTGRGIDIGDPQPSRLALAEITNKNILPKTAWQITMTEGRNRQIRRTFEALGLSVSQLHRVSVDRYNIAGIQSGSFKVD